MSYISNIAVYTVQNRNEWRGKISVWEHGRFLWSQTSEVISTNRDDALSDAHRMRREVLAENGYPIQ